MRLTAAVLLATALGAPAGAAPLIFSGVIGGSLGVATNPYLTSGQSGATAYGSAFVSPTLTKSTSVSSTTLSGTYSRQQYFTDYGNSDSETVSLGHSQKLSDHLSVNASASFSSTRNAFLSSGFYGLAAAPAVAVTPVAGTVVDPTLGTTALTPVTTPLATAVAGSSLVDALTIGQRSNILSGNAGLNWQATERDSFNGSVFASHSTYGGGGAFLAGDYDQYGGSFGYLHALTPRTKLGFQVTAQKVDSGIFGNSDSVEPGLTVQQVLSPIWTLNGTFGAVFQHNDALNSLAGSRPGQSYTGFYFNAQICEAHPRTTLCFTGARQSTPSGFGGLRTDLEAGVNLVHKLTEHSSVLFDASYDDSRSVGATTAFGYLGSVRVLQARGNYSRQLGRRLSGGFGGSVQRRDFGNSANLGGYNYGRATALTGTVNLSYVVGRNQ